MSEENTRTILIAEDNDVTRELMVTIMKAEGYKVLQAIDGGTAKKVVEDNKDVSLALVDLHMAPEGGFAFTDFLQDKEYKIPVIMVTGDQGLDLLLEVRKHKIMQLIQKPIEPQRLKDTVRRVLAKIYG